MPTLIRRSPYTCADAVLREKAHALFQKLYSRRMLIRLIGVKLSSLVQGSHQIDLFSDTMTQLNLYQAMDSIRMRFGASAVRSVAGMDRSAFRRNAA